MSGAAGVMRIFSPVRRELMGMPLLIAVSAVLLALLAVSAQDPGALPALLLVMAIIPAIFWRWPYGAIAAIFAGAVVPRISLKLFGLNLKVEHVAVVLFVAIFILCFRMPLKKFSTPDRLLIGLLAVTCCSSILFSPEPSTTLKNELIFVLAVLPYWILREIVNTPERFRRAMFIFLLAGAVAAVYGILCFVSHVVFGTMLGITNLPGNDLPAVHGSQWEPNIFGSFTCCFAAMFLFLALERSRSRGYYVVGLLTTSVAAMLSLARAAWIGLIMAAVVGFFLRPGAKGRFRRMLFPALVTVCIVALLLPLAMRIDSVRERVSTLFTDAVLEDPTLVHRLVFIGHALDDISQHPLLGMGSNSFGVLWEWDTDEGVEPAWVGNILIRIWHDSGIVGLALFLLFVSSLISQAWRLLRNQRSTPIGEEALAVLLGLVVLAVAYQATEASTLAYPWAHLGLVRAFLSVAQSGPLGNCGSGERMKQ
jgi:O-antigen ligase